MGLQQAGSTPLAKVNTVYQVQRNGTDHFCCTLFCSNACFLQSKSLLCCLVIRMTVHLGLQVSLSVLFDMKEVFAFVSNKLLIRVHCLSALVQSCNGSYSLCTPGSSLQLCLLRIYCCSLSNALSSAMAFSATQVYTAHMITQPAVQLISLVRHFLKGRFLCAQWLSPAAVFIAWPSTWAAWCDCV